MEKAQTIPKILVISSHVIRGSVGLRASVFALESLGHSVWSFPSILLPWHPGQGKSTRSVESEAVFAAMIDDMIGSKFLDEVDGILTGYMGAAYQVPHVARLINHIKSRNKNLFYLCDPVIGDGNALYVDEKIAQAIKDEFLPLADMISPNRFELAWLSSFCHMDGFQNNEQIVQAVRTLPPKRAVITSSFAMMRGNIGNLLVTENTAELAEHRHIAGVPNGLGDLTSALILARILRHQDATKVLEKATASVFEISHRSVKVSADELMLQANRDSLTHPMAQVSLRKIL